METARNAFAMDTDGDLGSRYVVRYNHLYDVILASHGTEFGRYRGGRAQEVYNNDFHWTSSTTGVLGVRSGAFVGHDNTHDGVIPQHGVSLTSYRIFQNVAVWGGSTGDSPWDVNATESDGTHVDGHPPYLFDSGTSTTGTTFSDLTGTATIVDSTKNWTTNQWVGYSAKNLSNGGNTIILSNTNNTLMGAYSNSHGQGVPWTAGDLYQIHKVLISQDCATRGAGDVVTGDTPVNSTTGTASWTHQVPEPAYMWNNKFAPTGADLLFWEPSDLGMDLILHAGVDYFDNTVMPGYAPYTYPHPLVSGGGHGPQSPGDLHIVP